MIDALEASDCCGKRCARRQKSLEPWHLDCCFHRRRDDGVSKLRVAKVEARTGLVRIYADKKPGVLTGAALFAPEMDHIAHLIAWVM
jgi:hypothetical protein